MRSRRTPRPLSGWRLSVAVAVAGLLVTSGCGLLGGQAEPSTPDGFARASTELISFGYPESWKKLPDNAYPEGWPLAFGKTRGQKGVEVAVRAKVPDIPDAQLVVESGMIQFQHTHNFTRIDGREIDVPGAESAWRLDYSYSAEKPSGGLSKRRVKGTDVAVVDAAGHADLLRITRTSGSVPRDTVEAIVDSLVVKSAS